MTTYRLKDGTEVPDPRLDRLIQFDEQSRAFPIRTTVHGRKPRSYTWRIEAPFLIDQGREGACVGFAVVNELMARPSEIAFNYKHEAEQFAVERIYYDAQRDDPWPGGAYPGASPRYDGTSVLAGVKMGQKLGYYDEYRWSFGIRDLVLGLSYHGPAVLGLNWHESNYTPDDKGFIYPKGLRVGGHAILARGVKIITRFAMSYEADGWDAIDLDKSYVILRNSWGAWGHKNSGDCYVTLRDMSAWLDGDGEAVFMLNRKTKNPTTT